jgi:TetR/AcrR family transcriptional repressor of nem operon
MNVFWSNGYHATSMPDLLKATGLSRGSLYTAFGDKRGIFLLALDRYIEEALARFDAELDVKRSAIDGLRACLTGYVDRTTGVAGRRGCLVVATAMELASQDPEIEKRLGLFFKGAETRLAKALTCARAEGGLAAGIEPATAARILLSMVEGLRVIAKTGTDRAVWQETVDTMLTRFLK